MSIFKVLKVGSIEVPVMGSVQLNHAYELIGGSTTLRTMNGVAIVQNHWDKLKVTISGAGGVPSGLSSLGLNSQLDIYCAQVRTIKSSSPNIAIPTKRRTDAGYEPFALVEFGESDNWMMQLTASTLNVNTLEITPVTGAIGYVACYYPKITAIVKFSESGSERDANYGWQLECEEV